MFVVALCVHVPGLPLADGLRATGVEVAAAPDAPDYARML
jgi:hypothetical protein